MIVAPMVGTIGVCGCSRQLGDVAGHADSTGEDAAADVDSGDGSNDGGMDDEADADGASDDGGDEGWSDGPSMTDLGPTPAPARFVLERLDWDGQGFVETPLWEFAEGDGIAHFGLAPVVEDLDGDGIADVYVPAQSVVLWGPVTPGAETTSVEPLVGAEGRLVGDLDGRPGAEFSSYGANSKLRVLTFDQRDPRVLDEVEKYAWHATIARIGGLSGVAYLRQWPTPTLHFLPVLGDQGFGQGMELELPPSSSGTAVRYVHGLIGSPDASALWSVLTPDPFATVPVDPAPSLGVTPTDGVTPPSEHKFPLSTPGEDGVWDPRGVFVDVTDDRREYVFASGKDVERTLTWVSVGEQGVQVHESTGVAAATVVDDCIGSARAIDVDRDGHRDVVFPCGDGPAVLTVWWSAGANGMSPLSSMESFEFPLEVHVPGRVGVGDLDGDGTRDLVWVRERN